MLRHFLAAWALPFPLHIPGEQQPHFQLQVNSSAAQLFLKEGSSQGKGWEKSFPSQEDGEVIPGTQSTPGAQIPGWGTAQPS